MTTYLPFCLSIFAGYLLVRATLRKTPGVNLFLLFFLSIGAGLGLSALITFLSFPICNGFNRSFIVSANLFCIAALLIVNGGQIKKILGMRAVHFNPWIPCHTTFLLLLTPFIIIRAQEHSLGEWDSWALWNMKAKFLTLSGASWQSVFKDLHWHTQPDYPLLLPCMNIWGWIFTPGDFFSAPFLTSVIFTFVCAGLLFAGLLQWGNPKIALLGCALLFALPAYLPLATSQYADIVLAYYLLAGFISFIGAIQEKSKGFGFLFGFFLGLMSFTKNEGLTMALLLAMLSIAYFLFEKTTGRRNNFHMIRFIFGGLAVALPVVIYFKFFLAPPNPDILLLDAPRLSHFFNLEGCAMILDGFYTQLTHPRWFHLWLLVLLGFLLDWRLYFKKEIKVLFLFFILYGLVIFFIYLATVNFSLMWRLSRTSLRILFCLTPSVIFLMFYVYANQEIKKEGKVL